MTTQEKKDGTVHNWPVVALYQVEEETFNAARQCQVRVGLTGDEGGSSGGCPLLGVLGVMHHREITLILNSTKK